MTLRLLSVPVDRLPAPRYKLVQRHWRRHQSRPLCEGRDNPFFPPGATRPGRTERPPACLRALSGRRTEGHGPESRACCGWDPFSQAQARAQAARRPPGPLPRGRSQKLDWPRLPLLGAPPPTTPHSARARGLNRPLVTSRAGRPQRLPPARAGQTADQSSVRPRQLDLQEF